MEASFNALSASTPKFVTYKDSEGQRHTFDVMAVDRISPHYKDLGVDWSTVSFKPDENGNVRDEIVIADSPEVLVDALNGKPSLRMMQSKLSQMVDAVNAGRLEYIQNLQSSYLSQEHAVEDAELICAGQKTSLEKRTGSLGWWTKRLLAAYEKETVGEIDEFVIEVTNWLAKNKFQSVDEILTRREMLLKSEVELATALQKFEPIKEEADLLGGINGLAYLKAEIQQEQNMSASEREAVIEGLFSHLSEGYNRDVKKSPGKVLFSMDHGDNLASYRLTADILKDNAQKIDCVNANTNPAAPPVLTLCQEDRVLEGPNVRKIVVERPPEQVREPKPVRKIIVAVTSGPAFTI